jgi:hypothetical protein
MRHIAKIGLAGVVYVLAPISSVRADVIPYPTPGIENPVTYVFVAANTGPITAYFAGSTAAFENTLGLNINGVSTGIFGLNNQTSAVGDSIVLGNANAGDVLTFVMHNVVPGIGDVYSDPLLNSTYDGGGIHNHVYSTPYTGTGPVIDSIPAGTFVSFEDLPNSGPYSPSDWNYNDEDFVFTNVGVTPSVPVPAAVWGGIVLMGGVIGDRRLRRRPA